MKYEGLVPVGIVGALALFIVLWDLLGPRRRQSDHPDHKEITGNGETDSGGQQVPDRPSADFAALIDAIRDEGDANRKEEQTEDRGRKYREVIVICLLCFNLVAICWQVWEMVKVYDPIKTQTEAVVAFNRAWLKLEEFKVLKVEFKGDKVIVRTHLRIRNIWHTPTSNFRPTINVYPYLSGFGFGRPFDIQTKCSVIRKAPLAVMQNRTVFPDDTDEQDVQSDDIPVGRLEGVLRFAGDSFTQILIEVCVGYTFPGSAAVHITADYYQMLAIINGQKAMFPLHTVKDYGENDISYEETPWGKYAD
jgi:hypothetical protein